MELLKQIKKIKTISIISILIIFTITGRKAYSDAWLQPEGSGLVITTFGIGSFNQTNQITGGSILYQQVGSFQIQNYFEYGLFPRITIGGKLIFTDLFQDGNGGIFGKTTNTASRFNATEIFTRVKILQYKYFIISTSMLIKLPELTLKNNQYLNPEFNQKGLEFQGGLELGFSFGQESTYIQNYNATRPFITFSYYYRKKIKTMDQITYYFTLGIPILERSIFFLKFQKINYIFHDLSTTAPRILNINGTQFSFADISFSYLTKISEFTHIEFGYKQSLHFKWLHTNTKLYNEKTFFMATWFYF